MSGYYPDGLTQDIFDRSNDMEQIFDEDEPGRDENPPEKIVLLQCGHFGIREYRNGEEFCTQCFDEYNEKCKEVIEQWQKEQKQ